MFTILHLSIYIYTHHYVCVYIYIYYIHIYIYIGKTGKDGHIFPLQWCTYYWPVFPSRRAIFFTTAEVMAMISPLTKHSLVLSPCVSRKQTADLPSMESFLGIVGNLGMVHGSRFLMIFWNLLDRAHVVMSMACTQGCQGLLFAPSTSFSQEASCCHPKRCSYLDPYRPAANPSRF